MDFCENNFVRFFYVPNLRNYMKRTMNLELLGNVPILYIREEPLRQASNRFIKRAFDVTVSSLFLCTLFPFIYIFVAIGTKLTSRGPVLFLQEHEEPQVAEYDVEYAADDLLVGDDPRGEDHAEPRKARDEADVETGEYLQRAGDTDRLRIQRERQYPGQVQ